MLCMTPLASLRQRRITVSVCQLHRHLFRFAEHDLRVGVWNDAVWNSGASRRRCLIRLVLPSVSSADAGLVAYAFGLDDQFFRMKENHMGWGRTLLLGDIGNRMDIGDVEEDVSRLKREIRDAYRLDMSQEERLERLVAENAELKLYLSATLRLLLVKGILDQAELERMVDTIDESDGERDGGYNGPVV